MSAQTGQHPLFLSLVALALPMSLVAACSSVPADTTVAEPSGSPMEMTTGESTTGRDDRLIVVTGNDDATEVGSVSPSDGTVTTLTSGPGSIRPAIVRLADGAVAVAESSGVTVFDAALAEITHAGGDATGFVTDSVSSEDGHGATFAYAVGDGQYPDRHLIVTVTTDGKTFTTTSDSVPVGLTRCADGHIAWLEAASPAPSFDGGELGKDVAVSRITASGPEDIRSEVLPAGPAPVWGRAGCDDTVSWVSGDGTAVTVDGGEATRTTVDTFRPASEVRGIDTSEGTAADGSIHRISGDGLVESYTFTPEPRFRSVGSELTGIAGATVTGDGDGRALGVAWGGDPSTGPFSVTAFDPDDTTCTADLGTVALPAGMSLLAATVLGEPELSCGR
ncbi:hypothetical protein JIM95_008965 [Corynebacterium sp. CCM 8835]|uniref:Secreted protein n=1 Tax=Corynebacterium antarcticum TaxID=2800405 RepID=A0A9Q4CCL0_9CORY|nr:hypothetical protein [Corynebacterium antarcticum]MCK7643017.1 hypothetical protein [Corynebacterium antarcticum]MCK7661520.1 hypothetical protein [Corynebacterium antarcticum]MCL0246263.1 hypothetical protein [Corynebacterium antarcticum]MCX7492514.1 hypothetical protein [Corynebacterium antarcticum]MCX7538379.1 hypothetical protein [Corynebacterium antarcticum]